MRVSLLFIITLLTSCELNRHPKGGGDYNYYCAACHGSEGEGFRALYPPLANADYYLKNYDQLPCIIRNGMHDSIQVNERNYSMKMLGIRELDDTQITNLINYMNQRWYPELEFLSLESTKRKLDNCK